MNGTKPMLHPDGLSCLLAGIEKNSGATREN